MNKSVASKEHRSVQCIRGTVCCRYELDTYRDLYVSEMSSHGRYEAK